MEGVARGGAVVNSLRAALCIPTLNAGTKWIDWLIRLKSASAPFSEMLVIDSSSDDDTVRLAKEFGFKSQVIERRDFNHGGTRQLAVKHLSNSDVIVFMTQDAIIASPDAIERLLKPFGNDSVGLAFGRQLPHLDAGLIGAHARLFNYPDRSEIRALGSEKRLGLKAAFVSDSFAAYRRRALLDVGGFPPNVIFGEDMVVAARMLLSGWKVAYQADASVYHSHDYSLIQEFRRYFDIGVLHNRESWLLEQFGKPEGEGMRFVKSELSYLLRHNPALIPNSIFRTGLKYVGYRLGRMEERLPYCIKPTLSLNRNYWANQ
jgi:rhamnosyltransferase